MAFGIVTLGGPLEENVVHDEGFDCFGILRHGTRYRGRTCRIRSFVVATVSVCPKRAEDAVGKSRFRLQ